MRRTIPSLASRPSVPDLPTDFPRQSRRFSPCREVNAVIEAQVVGRLGVLADLQCCSLLAVMLSAWGAFLHRLTSQTELVVWLPCAVEMPGDGSPETCKTCISMLPVSSRLEAGMTFNQYLSAITEQLTVALGDAHEIAGSRDFLSTNSKVSSEEVFPVVFSFEPKPDSSVAGHSARARCCAVSERVYAQTACELALRATERENGEVELRCDYAQELFAEATVQHWLGHFKVFLTDVALDAGRQLQEFELLTVEDREQILYGWNDTRRDYPTDVCLHDLIQTQVHKTPEATALVFDGQVLTYDGLNRRANRLAHRLRRCGVAPEGIVAVLAEASIETIVGFVAVLKAGGAYLPLDPSYPSERLSFVLREAQPVVVLTQRRWVQKLAGHDGAVLILEDDFEAESDANPATQTTPDNAAYVIYTSGSTGLPKGAVNIHRGICNYTIWWREYLKLTADDRFLQKVPLTFDPSVAEIFGTLISGATLVIARPGLKEDTRYLFDTISKQRVTTAFFVPSLLSAFAHDENVVRCSSLRYVISGGEVLSSELNHCFYSILPGAELVNIYGPAEAVIAVTAWRCERKSGGKPVPIGWPIANTQLYILDRAMRPVPVGIAGELYIGGVQVARGYLARPELTAEKFVPNPFGEGRLYKTGDLGRYRPDGAIEFLGRIDQQVKLHGLRIELGEIEAVLKKHPAVGDCIAVVREEEMEANKRLVAYVVASGESPDELRQHARRILPDYMVPSGFVFLDSLPVTAHGKLDRRALPKPVAVDRGKSLVRPQDALETQLVAIWEKVLRIHPIGTTDSFFQLGGDSLLALRLFAEIEQTLGKRLPLATLFQMPTVEKLAQKVREDTPPEDWGPLIAIQLQGKRPPFFAIHGRDGNVLFFRRFSECLGKEQPFYALQAQGLDGKRIARTSVEAIAEYYLEEIRKVQPYGPYLLGGFSFGGVAAYEMARRLRAAGEEIAFLVIFDAFNPAKPPRVRSWMKILRDTLRRVLSRGTTPSRILQFLAQHIRGKMGDQLLRWNESFHKLALGRTEAHRRDVAAELLDLHVQMVHERAFAAYRPLPYGGKITLMRTLDQDSAYEIDRDLGWSAVVQGGVEVHYVAGTHTSIFSDENVQNLARKVDERIQSALSEKQLEELLH